MVEHGVWSSRWVRNGMRVVALALVVLLAWRLHELWRQSPADFSDANTALLVLAGLLSLGAVVAYGAIWPLILRRIGAPVPAGAILLFLQSQLGKYVPGSVWQYAGRVGLAKARGVAARLTMISLGVEVGASAAAAGIVGLFVLPWPLAPVLALALALALGAVWLARGRLREKVAAALSRLVRRVVPLAPGDLVAALRATPSVAALYVPVWIAYGLAFWVTARALFPVPASDVVYFTATFAVGWLVGMAAVFAPGGIGVREAVLAGLLAPRVGHTEAIVIAGMSRIFLTGADLAGGGVALLLARISRPRANPVADQRL